MRVNKLVINWATQDEKTCLTIDYAGNNKIGPRQCRTQPNNPEKQVCNFNESRNYQVYNIFKSERVKSGNFEMDFYVKIDCVKSNTDSETIHVKQKLEYRNGTSNVQLSEQNAGTELYGWDNGNTKCIKQYDDKSIYRKSARPRFLSRR